MAQCRKMGCCRNLKAPSHRHPTEAAQAWKRRAATRSDWVSLEQCAGLVLGSFCRARLDEEQSTQRRHHCITAFVAAMVLVKDLCKLLFVTRASTAST